MHCCRPQTRPDRAASRRWAKSANGRGKGCLYTWAADRWFPDLSKLRAGAMNDNAISSYTLALEAELKAVKIENRELKLAAMALGAELLKAEEAISNFQMAARIRQKAGV